MALRPGRAAVLLWLALAPIGAADPREAGKAALLAGDPERALELLAQAASEGSDAALERDLGDACAGAGRLGEAAEHYRRSIALEDSSGARHNLGVVLGWLGEGEAAAAELERARALDPSQPEVDRHLANILLDLKRFEAAAAALERALARDPDHAGARIDLAEILLLRLPQREGQAGAQIERALSLAPQDARALYLRGAWRRRQGQTEAALADLRAAVARDPRLTQAHYELGQLLRSSGDAAGARSAFETFERLAQEAEQLERHQANLAADRKNPDSWILLAVQHTRMGALEEAARALQRALELEPGSAVALYDLALVRLRQDRRDDAVRLLERAIAADPERSEPRVLLERLRPPP